jgi:hypothetical protein
MSFDNYGLWPRGHNPFLFKLSKKEAAGPRWSGRRAYRRDER